MNKASIKGFIPSCKALEPSISPSKNLATKSWVSCGHILARTDMTPEPPTDNRGSIESSLPEYTAKSSGTNLQTSVTWAKSPQASLRATIFSTFLAKSATKEGGIFTPVREGTLYKLLVN